MAWKIKVSLGQLEKPIVNSLFICMVASSDKQFQQSMVFKFFTAAGICHAALLRRST